MIFNWGYSLMQLHAKRSLDIALFELVRLFLTKRGLFAVAAFSICWLIVLRYAIGEAVNLLNSPNIAGFIDQVFGAIGLSKLLTWPQAELAVYWLIAVYSFPSFCLFLCADQTVGDRQRGTLRFLSLRATRAEIILGRFIGQLLILIVLLSITLAATLAMFTYREPSLFFAGLSHSLILLGYLVVAVMPFIALMSLINTFSRSARLAFIVAILFFVGGKVIVGLLAWQLPALEVLNYIFPGYQLADMAAQNAGLMLAVGLPLIQTMILLIFAERIFARSSL
ncbi:MAG: ABC-type transport system involved in multi-copper enzyme maturation permease subunit [Bermanella sp.]|jgi:ABC-type transport system involved in multi-copper enzyme maturation permease subunit